MVREITDSCQTQESNSDAACRNMISEAWSCPVVKELKQAATETANKLSHVAEQLEKLAIYPNQVVESVLATCNRAKEIAEEEKKVHRGHNNMDDALRHAEWSNRITKELGPGWAWAFGTEHEAENLLRDRGSLDETLMDLHNNAEGRMAAEEKRPIDHNKLVTNPNNSSIYDPYTTPSQVPKRSSSSP